MCGICGVLDLARSTDEGVLAAQATAMATALAHRGPDDEGTWVDAARGIALGHRRLSVVDLSEAGHQPMVSASGRYVIAYNGEIYDHRRLSSELAASGHRFRGHSDTEVLLAGFDQWGIRGALERATGMFAIAVWDRERCALTLARDRLGEKPLYWGRAGKAVVFGSELKALRAHPAVHPEVDRDALALFFRHKYVPAPHTIYRGVEKVSPGELVTIGPDGDVDRERYWDAFDHLAIGGSPGDVPGEVDAEAAVDELEARLRESVAARLVADVPVGAFLSGGIDSSAVVAIAQAVSSGPVRTFTIGNTDPRFDEAGAAEAVAGHLGTDHTTLRVTGEDALAVVPRLPDICDEPFADSSLIPTFLVSQLARQHVTVSLSGDAGDELFGGYNRYRWVPAIWERAHRVPLGVRRAGAAALAAVPPRWVDQAARVVPEARRPRLAGTKVAKVAQVGGLASPEAMYLRLTSHWDAPARLVRGAREPGTLASRPDDWPAVPSLAGRMMAVDLVTYLPDDILVKLDRAAMAVSLEGRVPFLDHGLVEHALGLPPSLLFREGRSKWILRKVLERHVPRELVDRPKMGFGVPVGEWLRGPLHGWAADLVAPDRLRREGFLDADLVTRAWTRHQSGRWDHTYELWDVVVFQAWLERWMPAA
jgi:asparagine synthase (glutamine-hydrolysing)